MRHQPLLATPVATPSFNRKAAGVALVATAALLSACQSDAARSADGVEAFGHVHGIGVNPADGTVYVASHGGVFRLTSGGATLVADRAQDTMGFTIAGPDEFLGSGHPAPGDDAPNPLGLIRSTDGAKTWDTVTFGGEKDFHALDAVADRVYAYGSDGQLMMRRGDEEWTPILNAPLIDFAANPESPDDLVATTQQGEVIGFTVGHAPTAIADAPRVALIDHTADGGVVGVDPSGKVYVSRGAAGPWEEKSTLAGSPQALSVRADTWYAATDGGVFASSDQGQSWTTLLGGAS